MTKPILEINMRHPLVAAISTAKDAATDLSLLLLEQAQILDGELPEDPAGIRRPAQSAGAARASGTGSDGAANPNRMRQVRMPYLLTKAFATGEHSHRGMTMTDGSDRFYGGIPVFRGFGRLMDPALYSPLPDDWSIGIADIVESTRAIAEARYKAVNMAGASVIAAVTNALEGREFPFVFGGDGASFAVSPGDLDRAREALAATATWVEETSIW